MNQHIQSDILIFTPDDVDLTRSPLRNGLQEKTFTLGAFNPGLCRLPNGNLLLMVRVAEALREPVLNNTVRCIRWSAERNFHTEAWPIEEVEMNDPRKFRLKAYNYPVYALTSISWLLPVELNEEGTKVIQAHYDKAIAPAVSNQEYGIEDPRISFIDSRFYMTVCCVSSERHATSLFVSDNGLDYTLMGTVLDHQNKDMLLFEGKINNKYYALTRPMGECYFATNPSSAWHPGAAIHLSASPDLLHWKPSDKPLLRARRGSSANVKLGGGTPPVLTDQGWLILYHGVENRTEVGCYRTFWALLDKSDPGKILHNADETPLIEANASLTSSIKHQIYLNEVVFSTGIVTSGEDYIIASGELDLACRLTRINKEYFNPSHQQLSKNTN